MSQNIEVKDGKVVVNNTPRVSVKGTRICPQCGISESETLKKNDRYSFVTIKVAKTEHSVKMKTEGQTLMGCVYCYNKNRTKSKDKSYTREQIIEQISYFQGLLKMLDSATKSKS